MKLFAEHRDRKPKADVRDPSQQDQQREDFVSFLPRHHFHREHTRLLTSALFSFPLSLQLRRDYLLRAEILT